MVYFELWPGPTSAEIYAAYGVLYNMVFSHADMISRFAAVLVVQLCHIVLQIGYNRLSRKHIIISSRSTPVAHEFPPSLSASLPSVFEDSSHQSNMN